MDALGASLINYSILGNLERALHVHIHPRYDDEIPEYRRDSPFMYELRNAPRVDFDPERDAALMKSIREAIAKRTEIMG